MAPPLPAFLAAVLVLGACGSDGQTANPADGSLPPVTSPGPDIRVGADSIMPVQISDFVIGDGMPALPTNAIGFVFQAGGEVTADQVAALAAAFGIDGEPVSTDDGNVVTWQVGPSDGSGPVLYVAQDAQQSWSYSAAWANASVSSGCAVAVDSAGNTTGECPETPPPTGILTAAEAEQRARDLLAAIGEDPNAYEFEVYADEWYASVTAVRRMAGGAPVNQATFGFGADGVVQYANGYLAVPTEVGPYPLVDLETATDRLKGQAGMWSAYPGGIADGRPAVAGAEPASTVPGEKPYGEPVVVTLVDVQADFWWAWDADGSVWLLPAYRFVDTDGGWHVVPAVTDEFMIEVEPVPVPAPLPAETSFDTAPLNSLLGTPLDGFIADAETLGATVRVVQQDGELLPVTLDYSPTRVNVAVEGNLVVAIVNVG